MARKRITFNQQEGSQKNKNVKSDYQLYRSTKNKFILNFQNQNSQNNTIKSDQYYKKRVLISDLKNP